MRLAGLIGTDREIGAATGFVAQRSSESMWVGVMKPSLVVILALTAPALANCAGTAVVSAPAKPTVASAQPMAPVAAVQAQPLPPAPAAVQPALTAAPPGAAALTPPASLAAPATPPGAALGSVLGGPLAASLTDADRQAAWNAQNAALASGQSRSWRGSHGVFGFVDPGAETAGGCRAFSQTIYVAGRPNRGQGVACKQADGTWKVPS